MQLRLDVINQTLLQYCILYYTGDDYSTTQISVTLNPEDVSVQVWSLVCVKIKDLDLDLELQ